MEPNIQRDRRVYGHQTPSGLIPGLVLVAIGALFFLNNLHIVYVREWVGYWPVILIALGIVKLVDSNFPGGRIAGGVLFGLGVIFLAQTLGFLQIRMRDMWPLILIGFGLLMLFKRIDQWHVRLPRTSFPDGAFSTTSGGTGNNTVKIDSIFSGGKRVVTSQDFRGGEISSIFSGIELDLRQAGIVGDSVILDVNAIFGGVEIKIPQAWQALVEGVGVFGAFSDSTFPPDPRAPGLKRLIVKGGAVFGGVDVKN